MVTFHDKKGESWTEAFIIQDSLGIDTPAKVRSYLETERLGDYDLRDRTITKIERVGS